MDASSSSQVPLLIPVPVSRDISSGPSTETQGTSLPRSSGALSPSRPSSSSRSTQLAWVIITYAARLEEHVYQCAEYYFPYIDISSATTTTTAEAPNPTTTTTSSDGDAPAPTDNPNYASRRAAPALLGAAAGFFAALLF
ncbi:hypothetical protein P885DRAFT_79108 [Corynascus similis CBS 632.67]